jgi:hypothetical protein
MGIIKTLSVESHYAEYRYGMLILLCWVSHFLILILSVVMLSDVISEGWVTFYLMPLIFWTPDGLSLIEFGI